MPARTRLLGAAALALATFLVSAHAEWVRPTDWPVERIVRNLERQVAEHPGDADARFALGRTHGLAFTLEARSLAIWAEPGDDEPPLVCEDPVQRLRHRRAVHPDGSVDEPPPAEELLAHLAGAVRELRAAMQLAPGRAEIRLGLAYVLEHGAHLGTLVDTPELLGAADSEFDEGQRSRLARRIVALGAEEAETRAAAEREILADGLESALPTLYAERATSNAERHAAVVRLLARAWLERAIAAYRSAYEQAIQDELALEEKPGGLLGHGGGLDTLVGYEAGLGLQRLLGARAARDPDEERLLQEVASSLKALEDKPPCSWITPIVVSLAGCRTLEELLLPRAEVPFDLDGDGQEEAWPWIAPEAGFLVWDPAGHGRVTSGRQLFGSASGWLLFRDGYRVLAALDDDGDGRVDGGELEGIAVWFDQDTDGVSDPGEVVPARELGIVALEARATGRIGRSLANPCGVELADGRVLPSWDWMTRPVPPPSQRTGAAHDRATMPSCRSARPRS